MEAVVGAFLFVRISSGGCDGEEGLIGGAASSGITDLI